MGASAAHWKSPGPFGCRQQKSLVRLSHRQKSWPCRMRVTRPTSLGFPEGTEARKSLRGNALSSCLNGLSKTKERAPPEGRKAWWLAGPMWGQRRVQFPPRSRSAGIAQGRGETVISRPFGSPDPFGGAGKQVLALSGVQASKSWPKGVQAGKSWPKGVQASKSWPFRGAGKSWPFRGAGRQILTLPGCRQDGSSSSGGRRVPAHAGKCAARLRAGRREEMQSTKAVGLVARRPPRGRRTVQFRLRSFGPERELTQVLRRRRHGCRIP